MSRPESPKSIQMDDIDSNDGHSDGEYKSMQLAQHADTAPPSASATFGKEQDVVLFLPCPVFKAERLDGLPHSCNGLNAKTMSEVRRHLLRRSHVSFLKRCPTCKEDVLREDVFQRQHGENGELCNNPQKEQRGFEANLAQWEALYRKINPSTAPVSIRASIHVSRGTQDASTQTCDLNEVPDSHQLDQGTIVATNQEPSRQDEVGSLSAASNDSVRQRPEDSLLHHMSQSPWLPLNTRVGIAPHRAIHYKETPYHNFGPNPFVESSAEPSPKPTETDVHMENTSPIFTSYDSHLVNPLRYGVVIRGTSHDSDARTLQDTHVPSEVPEILLCLRDGCRFTFKGKYRLGNRSRHMRTKHGSGQYDCHLCGKPYRRSDARLKHIRKAHLGSMPELVSGPEPRQKAPNTTSTEGNFPFFQTQAVPEKESNHMNTEEASLNVEPETRKQEVLPALNTAEEITQSKLL